MTLDASNTFSRAGLPTTPWKNGGGSTRQIASWPPGAGMADFGWRVSIATIEAAGPFSVFEGVDRIIMLLDGDGVRLRSRDGRIDLALDVPHRPFAFAGEDEIDCAPQGAASSDFNVMTRRGQWVADLQVLDGPASIAPSAHGVLLALRGDWRLNEAQAACREGEGLWWADAPQAWQVKPSGAGARLAVARILPAAAQP
ncbi:HutD family protein [Variovorax sp. KK3]|uniref:HutD/Ves family protein n=1 Tax=Variovorax sp. KK3 TaxID=1855728 RepID=UPI00097C9527|nr:HutD family protein [Variovorax sp. KK3]